MFGVTNDKEDMNVIELLEFLSNSTRRRILELLAEEDLYPFQMSRLLDISPRLISKYLEELKELGIISFEKRESDKGPERTYATLNKAFSLIIDVGKNTFSVEYYPIGRLDKVKDIESLSSEIGYKKETMKKESTKLRDFIKDKLAEIKKIDEKRKNYVQEINEAFYRFNKLMEDFVVDYYDRDIIRSIFKLIINKKDNRVSLTELAENMRVWQGELKERIEELSQELGCIKIEKDRAGNIWYSI
ncbi:MAG: ArsR family transcriptional regulator [Candidatus Heimdallarchaeaceae archaeon]